MLFCILTICCSLVRVIDEIMVEIYAHRILYFGHVYSLGAKYSALYVRTYINISTR